MADMESEMMRWYGQFAARGDHTVRAAVGTWLESLESFETEMDDSRSHRWPLGRPLDFDLALEPPRSNPNFWQQNRQRRDEHI